VLELLAERGALHEQSYLDRLELTGLSITRVNGIGVDANVVQETLDAMRTGAPIIAQGALQSGQWGGRADVLRRVEKPSELGAWSYEVIDTKLARETKGNTVLQICHADVLFKPELQSVDLLDWQAYSRAIEIGYRHAIQNWNSLAHSHCLECPDADATLSSVPRGK
jgi:predicted RecB family nuclease